MIDLLPSRTVALILFGFPVHWYGLLYFAGFLIGWFLLKKLQKYRDLHLSSDDISSILSATVIGVIVGGRLGYVLFYNPWYYLQNPFDIFAVWKGGMASHGGFIGVTVALMYVLRGRTWDEFLRIADVISIPIAIGLGLGRIGNFINQELYGTITSLPWGMYFAGAEGLRHPIQLYDFALQMMIAGLCFMHLRRSKTSGKTFALFLILYGVARFLLEFIREQNGVYFWGLSEGQILTIPLLVIALWLWRQTGRRFVNR
jgi:phosphatidylglycerol---prolipoprotein diacylglyceryl transferase